MPIATRLDGKRTLKPSTRRRSGKRATVTEPDRSLSWHTCGCTVAGFESVHYGSIEWQSHCAAPKDSPMTSVLHPKQFQVNEAWIAFQLNETPISTDKDGSFNCICLMDAASCYIFGTELIPTSEAEPSQRQARDMLTAAWAKKGEFPQTLFVPTGRYQGTAESGGGALRVGGCFCTRGSAARLYR